MNWKLIVSSTLAAIALGAAGYYAYGAITGDDAAAAPDAGSTTGGEPGPDASTAGGDAK